MDNRPHDLLNIDELLPVPLIPARWPKRIGNALLDFFFSNMLIVGVIFGIELLGELDGAVLAIGYYSCYIAYYVLFEWLMGKTPGKMVTGTKVINEAGQKPTLGQAFGRFFARLIPFEVLTMIGSRPRGLHDSLPRTWVVDDRPRFSLDRSLSNQSDYQ